MANLLEKTLLMEWVSLPLTREEFDVLRPEMELLSDRLDRLASSE